MDTLQLIEKLSNAPGVSGFESPVIDITRSYLPKSFDLKEDRIETC